MSGIYQELADRIAGEVPELDRLVQRIEQRWLHGKVSPEQQDVYLEGEDGKPGSHFTGVVDSSPRRIISNC